jgi:N-acetylmuramoyl-L-alanine amidase
MIIKNNILNNAQYKISPNIGRIMKPIGIVVHYTGSPSLNSAVNWIVNKDSKISYHIVIGRKGEIVQTCPFNRVAWHAGISTYYHGKKKLTGLNNCTIGVSLENLGRLQTFKDRPVNPYNNRQVIIDSTNINGVYWHNYTPAQINVMHTLCKAIINIYNIQFIVGHSEIAKGRKIDPGPLLDMESLKKLIKRTI